MTEFTQHPIEILSQIEAQEYVKGSLESLVMIDIDAIPDNMSIKEFKEMWYSHSANMIFSSDNIPPREITLIEEVDKLVKPIVR